MPDQKKELFLRKSSFFYNKLFPDLAVVFDESPGGDPEIFFEMSVEQMGIRIPGLFRCFPDGQPVPQQEFHGIIQAAFMDILKKRHTHFPVETAAQIIGMQTGHLG